MSLALLMLVLACSNVARAETDSALPDREQELFIRSHSHVSVVRPERVDGAGRFLSHVLAQRPAVGARVFYRLQHEERPLLLNLTLNPHLLAQDHLVETRGGGAKNRTERCTENTCHLLGTVTDGHTRGTAAISTCLGLTGLLTLPAGVFLIEPVRGHTPTDADPHHPHVIYRNSTWRSPRARRSAHTNTPACGVRDGVAVQVEQDREVWEQEQGGGAGRRRMSRRSVSTERWVETMVVADSKLLQYHGNNNVESYIFTIMNMVAGVFHDASIGNAIHIILVRLILLQGEEKGLKIVHHADSTLNSFCSWQKNLNPQSDTHPAHHDVAVLITRKDLCAGRNEPCETLGLSHLSGMCQPHRSCNINEDSGLPVAFTIAHELGHSFGIQHDGQGNDCEQDGRHPFIMSRQLQYDSAPLTWSSCSKEYITRFLDRGWGFCLDDRPSKKDLTAALVAPGVRYTQQHQCQMQYGSNATFCSEVDNVCQILWCSVNGSCRSKLDAPIDGTRCGPGKWCISGECVIVGKLPETVNGGWGQWSTWSHCSRTCGSGVQSAERECDQPKPAFGGRYCTGERRRYRICNILPCVQKLPSFRDMQCSEFDTVPYQNQLYQWIPVSSTSHPCELHCRPVSEDFSEKMLDAVTDGTPCFNNNSRSICINGVCKAVGCDYGIDSRAEEDRCGVCLGDGSSCETLKDSYTERDGYGYVDMMVIPEGARDIYIEEVEEAGNFLAVRAAESEDYFLNGNYIIQWNGEYRVGGATFFYDRHGNLENLTSPGPTTQPIVVQLLFQEPNPGVRFEYTVKKNRQTGNELLEPEYSWKYGAWTDCSATCGQGEQQQPVRCFEAGVGVVDEALCDPNTRPDDGHRRCKNIDCPARWWVGGWQQCSASCGPDGVRKRTVLCVRTVGGEERVLHPGDCKHLPKPKPAVPCNRDITCGTDWTTGNWSQCSLSCGGGVKSRMVKCSTEPQAPCDPAARPRSTTFCNLQSCSSTHKPRPQPRRPTPKTPPPTTEPPTHHDHTHTAPTHTPPPDVFHEDDRDFILVKNSSAEEHTHTTVSPGLSEEEEGSAGPVPPGGGTGYTPGYDYIVEEDGAEERDAVFTVSPPAGTPTHTPPTTTEPDETTATTPQPQTTATTPQPQTTPPAAGHAAPTHTALTTTKPDCTKTAHTRSRAATATHRALPITTPTSRTHSKKTEQRNTHTKLKKTTHTPRSASNAKHHKSLTHTPGGAAANTTAFWVVGKWSKCPEGCSGGVKQREVQCVDAQTGRGLRPFHCQALSPRPPRTLPCSTQPCLQWAHLPWAQCSKSCGGGVMGRVVFCPEDDRCNAELRPNSSAPCNLQPCTAWSAAPWQECSVSCGDGGVQKRGVKCVNEESGEEEESELCPKNSKPESVRKCSLQECRTDPDIAVCKRNSMSSRFCAKLKLLGRCVLRSIRRQCCLTCMT
ncbi:A disintegrin and metalloproteinase with thrombospondin motifs 7 isoform X2 [Astyanax mexicanus]|uniref:A disintegrin and metalloproteinase with thrombospondin motifs 7 isoform X2 n=1 Tax=Astyanax mexicanus TaxID=7994 RepID=UPI0020CB654C|nr:A disintegrin and metalloproteinase with thrombospondin motifs 7 isoform X2 [Astyanax mexicanus]